MVAPRATVLRESLLKTLPSTITVGNDAISVGVAWMTQPPNPLPNPVFLVGTGAPTDLTEAADAFEGVLEVAQAITNEPHTFTTGDLVTPVDEKDVDAVTSVTGTAGGNAHTFVEGTDFDVVDDDGDGALDALKWKSGGTKPDNGTTVNISYEHKLLETSRSHLFRQLVILHCISSPLKSGQGGATQAYQATEVVEAMQQALVSWFEKDLRPALEAALIALNHPLNGSQPVNVEDSALIQQTNTFTVMYQEDATLGQVRRVRKVTTTAAVDD